MLSSRVLSISFHREKGKKGKRDTQHVAAQHELASSTNGRQMGFQFIASSTGKSTGTRRLLFHRFGDTSARNVGKRAHHVLLNRPCTRRRRQQLGMQLATSDDVFVLSGWQQKLQQQQLQQQQQQTFSMSTMKSSNAGGDDGGATTILKTETSQHIDGPGVKARQNDNDSSGKDDDDDSTSKADNDRMMIFPWRHEETPLPRYIPGTPESISQGHLISTTTKKPGSATLHALATAFMFMDVPLYQFLFFGSWQDDLAESMSWAFAQSVAGLLSNLSHKKTSSIIEDADISFQHVISKNKNVTSADGNDGNGTGTLDNQLSLDEMMDPKLLSLFQTSKEKLMERDDETEVCLECIPISAEMVSLYCIPYISRDNIQRDPNLLSFYRDMLEKPAMDRAPDMNLLRGEKLERGLMESTVIAQVQVWCNELFYVRDVKTGKILQGWTPETDAGNSNNNNLDNKDDEMMPIRLVPHLVRMEMTVKTRKDSRGNFQNEKKNWRITDIDDLLDGNLIL